MDNMGASHANAEPLALLRRGTGLCGAAVFRQAEDSPTKSKALLGAPFNPMAQAGKRHMKRKQRNENTDGTGSHPAKEKEQDEYVITRRREEKHNQALACLEKTFGKDDFSVNAANRVGVDTRILSELVGFGFVRCFEGRYDLKIQVENFSPIFDIPIRCYRFDSDFMQKYQHESFKPLVESKAFQESAALFFARPTPDSAPKRFDDSEPMNIFKRFRWPFSVYLLLTARFRNLSAYIRFLVYSDLGMTKEAEIEKARMGPRV